MGYFSKYNLDRNIDGYMPWKTIGCPWYIGYIGGNHRTKWRCSGNRWTYQYLKQKTVKSIINVYKSMVKLIYMEILRDGNNIYIYIYVKYMKIE